MTGLRQCASVVQHQHPGHLSRCPFCSTQSNASAASTAFRPTATGRNHPHSVGVGTPAVCTTPALGTRQGLSVSAPPSTTRRPPWQIPAVVIALVAVIVAAAGGLGLISTADRPGVEPGQQMSTSTPSAASPATAPDGAWVTVLASLNQDEVTLAKAGARARKLSTSKAKVYVLDSTKTPGLNPGYWALVLMPFPTRAKAAAACSAVDRSVGGTCYPRLIG